MTCQCAGGVLRKHNRVSQVLCGIIRRWTGQTPLTEQRVPAWDRTTGPEEKRRAILDIEYMDEGTCRWIDVSIRHPAAGGDAATHRAARRPGEAARRGEKAKHSRYPGANLTAFVVEAFGRVGAEARQWLQKQSHEVPEDKRVAELTRAYKAVSCAVQAEMAKQLRAASGLK